MNLLRVGAAQAWDDWTAAGVRAVELSDIDGSLTTWLRDKHATVVALRPDGIVYAAAGPDNVLAAPPRGLKLPQLEALS